MIELNTFCLCQFGVKQFKKILRNSHMCKNSKTQLKNIVISSGTNLLA